MPRFVVRNDEKVLRFGEGESLEKIISQIPSPSPSIYDEIDERNGWKEPGEIDDETRDKIIAESVKAYGEMFFFCFSGASGVVCPVDRAKDLRESFRKFVALTWQMFPDLLVDSRGRQLNQARIAVLLGVKPPYVAGLATRFGQQWNFHSRSQKNKTARENHSIARRNFLAKKHTELTQRKAKAKKPARRVK